MEVSFYLLQKFRFAPSETWTYTSLYHAGATYMSLPSGQYIEKTAKHPCTVLEQEKLAILLLKYHTIFAYVNLKPFYSKHIYLYFVRGFQAPSHRKKG